MTASARARICPDCPCTQSGILVGLAEKPSGCAFRCLSVCAREALPPRWRIEFGLALVRRGIIVRQRVDTHGRATAVDIAGPGSAMLVAPMDEETTTGYAVDDAMLCLCPAIVLDTAVDEGGDGARDVVRAHATMIARIERIAVARSRATAEARVAGLLLAIADTLTPSQRLETIPATIQQRDLAALLALRHESVCRVLAVLTRRGVLERTAHGMHLLDRAALAAV